MVHFYKFDKTRRCPHVEVFVKEVVQKWYFRNKSVTAALLRMHYSDCFVRGCDASILLDGYNGNQPEKKAPQNLGLRAFDVVDDIKAVVEKKCPGVVSCADILALAARDVLSLAGGPAYPVPTGRKDGVASSIKEVNLPGPDITLKDAIALFKTKGLELEDLVTLLGQYNYSAGIIQNAVYSRPSSLVKRPKDFVCPITDQLFEDPVTIETGQTYEYYRSAIFPGKVNCALNATPGYPPIMSARAIVYQSLCLIKIFATVLAVVWRLKTSCLQISVGLN